MPYILNDKIKNLTPYAPISGDYRIRLDANESYICLDSDKVSKAFNLEFNRYPDPYATKLCKAFAEFYNINAEHVTAGNGSDELISLIVGAFFSHGDTVLTLSNDFSMYKFYGDVFGINTVVLPKNDDLTIDANKVISYINENKISGLIFSNPCNPTSLCLNRDDVIKIIESTNALIIVDEAYMDFYEQSILDVCHEYDNVIVLKTCSKAIGLAAIRLGFAIANDVITKALRAVKSPYNVNSITQAIGEIVLSDKEYIKGCTSKLIENCGLLYNRLLELNDRYNVFEKIYETTTNFVFIKTEKAEVIFSELLKRSIAVRCMGGYLRISTGSQEENETLIKELTEIAITLI